MERVLKTEKKLHTLIMYLCRLTAVSLNQREESNESFTAEQLYIIAPSQRENSFSNLLKQDHVFIYICRSGDKCELMLFQWIIIRHVMSAYYFPS